MGLLVQNPCFWFVLVRVGDVGIKSFENMMETLAVGNHHQHQHQHQHAKPKTKKRYSELRSPQKRFEPTCTNLRQHARTLDLVLLCSCIFVVTKSSSPKKKKKANDDNLHSVPFGDSFVLAHLGVLAQPKRRASQESRQGSLRWSRWTAGSRPVDSGRFRSGERVPLERKVLSKFTCHD